MQQNQPSVTIRPVRVEDAEAIWQITREPGVIETILALPSQRVEQRSRAIANLGEDEHYFVAEIDAQVVGLAGLTVGNGRLRHRRPRVFVCRPAQPGSGRGYATAGNAAGSGR